MVANNLLDILQGIFNRLFKRILNILVDFSNSIEPNLLNFNSVEKERLVCITEDFFNFFEILP